MNKSLLFFTFFLFISAFSVQAQVNYTANDQVTPYEGDFRPGINKGYRPPYSDEQLANIAAGYLPENIKGLGVKTLRPALYGNFVETYGYDFHVETYNHYRNLGMSELTCIVGFPSEDQREQTEYCPGIQSTMFANLYTDIWDNGENGTPYNDENYFAAYLYKVVSQYKDHVRFWEIWNEPGFDTNGNVGWRGPGDQAGNWWDNDPNPCDNILRAPIQSYIRTLRIAYDVIKTVDPDAYVVVAGVGFPSFLDAILRNTDNPNGGAVSAEYPQTGGAYFDVMGFHSYPDIDGSVREFNSQAGKFDYFRHSDAAAQGVFKRQAGYREILEKHGYGTDYPEKEWIITEINVPRKAFGSENMGSIELQRNYIIKAMVTAQKAGARQMQVYTLSDQATESNAQNEFDLMGLYKAIQGTQPYDALEKTATGVAYKTGSDMLYGATYDASRTAEMNMPANVDGGAFRRADGSYVYVVWAKTTVDRSEDATASYTFPSALGSQFYRYEWDFSETNTETQASGAISLTATPSFLTVDQAVGNILKANFSVSAQKGCTPFEVSFTNATAGDAERYEWTFEGGTPATSTAVNPVVTFEAEGLHRITLKAFKGNEVDSFYTDVEVGSKPQYQTSFTTEDLTVRLSAFIEGQFFEKWILEDGREFAGVNRIITFDEPGTYEIVFFAGNECGNITDTITVTLPSGSNPNPDTTAQYQAVNANFSADITEGCAGFQVSFDDISTGGQVTNRLWAFVGGSPATSTAANPVVTYRQPGIYQVSLVVSNPQFNDQITRTQFIEVKGTPTVNFASNTDQNAVSFESILTNTDSVQWNFGDGNGSVLLNPTHVYTQNGTYTVSLTAYNECDSATLSRDLTINQSTTPTESLIALFNVNNRSICAGSTADFTSSSTGNPTQFEWTFEGGTPSTSAEAAPSVVYNEAGTFDVSLFIARENGSNLLEKKTYMQVFDAPQSDFEFENDDLEIAFVNNSNNGVYLWDFGDGNQSSLKDPVHMYTEEGTYMVKLTTENVCGAQTDSMQVEVRVNTSVDNLSFVDEWKLYPNPADELLHLSLQGKPNNDPMTVRILNVIGQTVYEERTLPFKGTLSKTFDVSNYPKGVYLMELSTAKETGYTRFLKK